MFGEISMRSNKKGDDDIPESEASGDEGMGAIEFLAMKKD